MYCYSLFGLLCSSALLIDAFRYDECEVEQKSGVDWILQAREADYGWKENTHRANVALAVALAVGKWKSTEMEMRNTELQLELELTKTLLGNATFPIRQNELALFIHALLAWNKNPRNFHGFDLVEDLLHRVSYSRQALHPFLVLALCDSSMVQTDHLERIKSFLVQKHDSRYQIEMMALALKAFACAVSSPELDKFQREMETAVNFLISIQNKTDGSFGNPYTTALVVQALIASDTDENWEKEKALEYLDKESKVEVNMIKTCLIIMAENADNVKFIKDLYPGKTLVSETMSVIPDSHTIKVSVKPNNRLMLTLSIEVPKHSNLFEIMEICSQISDQFNFTYYKNKENNPVFYSISGIPNDAEENKFWLLCVERAHGSVYRSPEKYINSPATLIPRTYDVITFRYGESVCPVKAASVI